jgi:hypothetical protein
MLPEDIDFEVVNSIARVGRKSASKFTPDLAHVAEMIGTYHPRLVLACGQAAQQVVERLGVACCPAPHPAWRRLSKQQTADIRGQLARLLA